MATGETASVPAPLPDQLADLKAQGLLDDAEFAAAKARLLG